jgi:hypothetical protein
MPDTKLAILIAANPATTIQWTIQFPAILNQCPPGSVYLSNWLYGVDTSREMLTANAKALEGITHYLFVDTDVCPAGDCIPKLIQANVPVVSGAYYNSFLNGLAAWQNELALQVAAVPKLDEKGQPLKLPNGSFIAEPDKFIDKRTARPIGPIVEVDKVGLGMCLIKKEVFDTLEEEGRPFFYYQVDSLKKELLSEDFWLFKHRLAKLGIKPHVHLGAQCVHLKTVMVNWDGGLISPDPQTTTPK